jgi:hypothetical protein
VDQDRRNLVVIYRNLAQWVQNPAPKAFGVQFKVDQQKLYRFFTELKSLWSGKKLFSRYQPLPALPSVYPQASG